MTLLAPAPAGSSSGSAQGRLSLLLRICSGLAHLCWLFGIGQKALSYICKQTGGKQIQGGDGDGPIHSSDFLRVPFRRPLPFLTLTPR